MLEYVRECHWKITKKSGELVLMLEKTYFIIQKMRLVLY